jgi:DNA adenine methylase
MKNIILSPLRYPGSKGKLVNHIKKVLAFNEFDPEVVVEPFVGGGSVFLNFLNRESVEEIIIGDKDPLVYSFWKVLFSDPNYLQNFVKTVEISVKNFNYYRTVAQKHEMHSERKLAEACLFLNRTSFSGILSVSAGPIGGRDQESIYKIDCRFNRRNLEEKIKQISSLGDKVTVRSSGWKETIAYAEKRFPKKKILFYFDPPFYAKAEKLYRYYFKGEEHVLLSNKIKALKGKWILSYDRANEIRTLYRKFIRGNPAFAYSINSPARRIKREFFITNLRRPTKHFLTHK